MRVLAPTSIPGYEGNDGGLGSRGGGPAQSWVWPHFDQPAAALLGFDESIDWFCRFGGSGHAEACVESNLNILSLFNGLYNTCVNYEWQICAARGMLPGQNGAGIQL